MMEKFILQARVLICGEEQSAQNVISVMRPGLNCASVQTVRHGQEAVVVINKNPVDLIIIDISPAAVIHGVETAADIKSIVDVPIVYLVKDISEQDFDKIRQTAPAGIIEKPFNDSFLIYALEIALDNYNTLDGNINRYKKITEAITDYIYTVKLIDNKAVETIHGPMCETVTGYTAEEFTSDPFLWFKIIYEKDIKRVSFHFDHLLENREQRFLEIEHRIIKKNGTIRWVRNSTVFHYNDAGTIKSYDGVIRDITDEKDREERIFQKNDELTIKVEEKTKELEKAYSDLKTENAMQKEISRALVESRQRFFDLANFLPEITYEMNKNGIITFVNENGIIKLGYNPEDIAGFNGLDILSPEDRERAALNMLRILNGENIGSNSYNIVTKDGTVFPALFHSQHFLNEEGESIIRGIVVDISSQKSIEDQLRQSQRALKERIALTDMELREARRIHQMLLPQRVPLNDIVKTSFRYEPYVVVGGDYFSFYKLKEMDGLGIFIGDVSGHGVSAALFTSLIKTNTDYVCREFGTEPSQYLKQLNSVLYHNLNDHFITGIYGFFYRDSQNRVIFTFSNAGHPEVIVYRKEYQQVEQYRPAGKLLGVLKECSYEQKKIVLGRGDRVFLFTDGLVETTDKEKTMISESDFLEIIEKNNNNGDIDSVLEKIMMNLSLFRKGADIVDDMLIVGFEVL